MSSKRQITDRERNALSRMETRTDVEKQATVDRHHALGLENERRFGPQVWGSSREG